MISLKQTMEAQREELIGACLDGYRATVTAAAESAGLVCPALAAGLSQNLAPLQEALHGGAAPGALVETGLHIDRHLADWGRSAADYFRQKTAEVQQLVLDITEAVKTVAARDTRYQAQFTEVTRRLQAAGNLEDLAQVRILVGESAAALRTSVERMVEEGRETVGALEKKLAQYEERLAEAERRSETDPLTGLLNRQGLERDAERKVAAAAPFCLIVIDLNGFKAINDTYGHPAGDNLLCQFSHELKSQFRAQDSVGRWGGDEFVALLACTPAEVAARVERIRKWVFGDYAVAGAARKIAVGGAIGTAAWRPGQSAAELFAEADRAMFQQKRPAAR